MSKKKKQEPYKITVEVPDEQHLKYITDAYGLVCKLRTINKAPHERMERWLLRMVVEGSNAIFDFYTKQLAEQNAAKSDAASTEPVEVKTSANVTESENVSE